MDIPDNRWLALLVVCLIICPATPNFAQAPTIENTDNLITYQGRIVMGVSSPQNVALNGVLVSLVGENELNYREAVLLQKIIECESGWKNVCNKEFGCDSGQGIVQLIPTTVKHCEKKLGKGIDPFNIYDSVECAAYLLKEEGYQHWGTELTEWGSYNCFQDYLI